MTYEKSLFLKSLKKGLFSCVGKVLIRLEKNNWASKLLKSNLGEGSVAKIQAYKLQKFKNNTAQYLELVRRKFFKVPF